MIPKIIHYCWFGRGELPELAVKCIQSWKRFLPDYELKLWNEDSFDIDSIPYVRDAYASRKYAFVSDYVRLYALLKFGGIYLDTDIEVLKSFNPFLNSSGFLSQEEDTQNIATCIIGSVRGALWLQEFMASYQTLCFINPDGSFNMKPNVLYLTSYLKENGWQADFSLVQCFNQSVNIYPSEYFCPKQYRSSRYRITANTHCIHHFSGSWLPRYSKFKKSIYGFLGSKLSSKLRAFFRYILVYIKK